ncbi:hypothetical protein [Rhizobium terrae]|nr:hypothetical protein [Rhizobium terrae]
MADSKDEDPAEGSRQTVENELKREKSTEKKSDHSDEGLKQKRPAQPRSS